MKAWKFSEAGRIRFEACGPDALGDEAAAVPQDRYRKKLYRGGAIFAA
jgi:hypothetical protein